MDYNQMQMTIETIKRMKNSGVFINYIEYIDFPFYKNLIPRTRINFEFPMTVLIGKNGSGKSSTLHALFGAPQGYTCSDFWFSTDVDPIAESGDRNRYFYEYVENKDSDIKEVMKLRMKRGSETKKEDLDYWETSRPLMKDGMLQSKRNSPVNKDVIYLDFRAEVSAFDKIFHFSKENLDERKNLLRQRSKYLKRLFNGEPMKFKGTQDNKVGNLEILSENTVKCIGKILNKEYTDIRVAEHKLYRNMGTSVYMKNKYEMGYSEANAGSGEIAVVQLVRRIERARDYSLVLLDEPEVSLHPGAQENLKEYLLEAIKTKKLQVVISTHSPTLIKGLPSSAIKLFKTNEYGKFYVQENINYEEAFFDIENRVSNKKMIFCEDYAAQKLVEKVLMYINKEQYFDVVYYHGGEKTLVNHYMTPIALNRYLSQKIYLMLDGDMKTDYVFNEDVLTKNQIEDDKYLERCVKDAYGMCLDTYPDSGNGNGRVDQKCEQYLSYLRYYKTNVFYLPGKMIPEEIILKSNYVDKMYKEILNQYRIINASNAKEVIREISEFDHGDGLHINDTISVLANKWSQEESILKTELIDMINEIFNK